METCVSSHIREFCTLFKIAMDKISIHEPSFANFASAFSRHPCIFNDFILVYMNSFFMEDWCHLA